MSREIWSNPGLRRSANHAYLFALNLLHGFLDLLPWFLRNAIWKCLLGQCGSGVYFDNRIYIKFPWLVSLGSNVSVNRGAEFYCSLKCRSRIVIGSNVRIAPNVRFHAAGHDPDLPDYPDNGEDITVDDDVWIGAGAIILQGSHIRRGAVIAAGAVVTGTIPDDTIAGGVPARTIRAKRCNHAAS